jgi:hypothetical protein
MTVKSAASAIVDDIVDSGSFLRTQVSACDFGVIDTGGACCVVVRPGFSSSHEYIGYGGVSEDSWRFRVMGYIKFSGDVADTMGKVLDMHDALKGAVNGGSRANCASLTTRVNSIEHNPDEMLEIGGMFYSQVTANVTAREDPA